MTYKRVESLHMTSIVQSCSTERSSFSLAIRHVFVRGTVRRRNISFSFQTHEIVPVNLFTDALFSAIIFSSSIVAGGRLCNKLENSVTR